MVKKILAKSYVYLILLIMYLPILLIIAFAFSSQDIIGSNFGDFTLDLFVDLFTSTRGKEIWVAMGNTLIIAVTSSLVSVILGTLGAIGVFYYKRRANKVVEVMTQIPVANAEIVMALSLAIMFVFVGQYIFGGAKLFSYWTLLIGHVVISLPFVYLSVKPKLQQMDPNLYEAALDLGCTPNEGLTKVIIPQIVPGIFSGFLLAFTLSLDDFVVTAYTRGPGLLSGQSDIDTLSTYIQAVIKRSNIPAELRPLTLFIFLLVVTVVIGYSVYENYQAKKHQVKEAR